MADNPKLLWILVSSALAATSLISTFSGNMTTAGITGLLAASLTVYSTRLGRTGKMKDRMLEKTGYLGIESALLASIILNPVIPRWLAILAVIGFAWAEILPETYRKIFSSKIWLTMGREVRIVLLGLGIAAGTLNDLVFFYMTTTYLGICLLDVVEVAVKARAS